MTVHVEHRGAVTTVVIDHSGALTNECHHEQISLASGKAEAGAGRFREGEGHHGRF